MSALPPRFLPLTALLISLLLPSPSAASEFVAQKAAISSGSPYATQIGVAMLQRGGNAIDAAVAVAFALTVAHPQAGNIAGGGFLVYYEAKSGSVWTLDFREVAPAELSRKSFVNADGSVKENASLVGGLAVGVPGSIAGLAEAHRKFGSLPWKDLIAPSASLARSGVRTDETLSADLRTARDDYHIDRFPATAALYYPGGEPLAAGSILRNAALADTLDLIAERGAAEFYDGTTAKRMVRAVRDAGGVLSRNDLRDYRPVWRAPIRIDYGPWQIFTVPPPSGGGIVMAEMLGMLNGYDLPTIGFQSPAAVHLLAETARRAYFDRSRYIGDPLSSHIPLRELLSPSRAAQWRSSISMDKASAGGALREPGAFEPEETTHFTIADPQGNVAAVTTTLNGNFGAGFVVPDGGFFMNDEIDDFAIEAGKPNVYGLVQSEANGLSPHRRMASSMTPTIVLRDGRPLLALGTRGGPTIPLSVLQVFLNVCVYHKPLAEAVNAPRFHQQGTPDQIRFEKGRASPDLITALTAMGHDCKERDPIGEIHAILFAPDGIHAMADPRGTGAAGGY